MRRYECGSRWEHESTELALTPKEWKRLQAVKRRVTLYDESGLKFEIRCMTSAEWRDTQEAEA